MKKTRNLHQENQKILQEHSGLQQLVKAKMKKIKLRRVIAILSCFVLLLTINQLKFKADTLQRLPACDLCEHVHTESCYQDGELICGLPEHEHTDACYQQRPVNPEPTVFDEFMDLNSQVVLASPSDEDAEVSVENVDESVSETTIELGDDGFSDVNDDSYSGLEVEMDLDDLYDEEQADDGNEDPSIDSNSVIDGDSFIDNEPSKENEAVYTMPGDSVTFLSDVLNSVGMSLSSITSVGEIVEEEAAEAHISIEAVEGVDGEYALRVVKNFDRITLGVITDSDIIEIVLKDGVAAGTDAEGAEELEAVSDQESEGYGEEYRDDTGLDDEFQETVELVIENEKISNNTEITEIETKQTKVDEGQTEVGNSDLIEEAASALAEGDLTLVEGASMEVEDEASEDEVSENKQSEDAEVDDANGDASADEEMTGDSSAIGDAQGEEAADDSSVKDEKDEDAQNVDSQSEDADGDTSVKDKETAETEEKQDAEKQDADEDEQGDEEQPSEEQTEEDQSGDEGKDPSDEEVEDAADGQTEDEQQVEDGSEAEGEQQGDAEQSEDEQQANVEQNEAEQTVIRHHVSLDFSAYIVADSHTVYLYDDAMNAVLVNTAEIDSVDGVVVTTTAEEVPGEKAEVAEAEEAPVAEEEQTSEVDTEAVEEQPERKSGVLVITGDGEYTLDDTIYTATGLVLPGTEEPSNEEEAPTEVEPSDEEEGVEEEAGDEESSAADQTPVMNQVIVGYKLEYDLAEVEAYPLSLRGLMAQAEPVYEEVIIESDVSADDNDSADEEETVDGEEVDPTTDAEAADENSSAVTATDAEVKETTGDATSTAEEAVLEETVDSDAEVAGNNSEPVEYDDALIAVEQIDEDWLITPAVDFETTEIVIGLYEITLLNGKVPITYPAVVFDDSTEYINVHVEAPEGAFPEGTTMHLEDVVDEQALAEIGDAAVTEENVEVQRVHAVDITFRNKAGQEIEPRTAISVVMTLREIEKDEETVVVHMDDEGNINTVSTDATPMDTVLPAEDVDQTATDAAETGKETVQSAEETPVGTVAFTTDAFSIYAMVVTKKIETRYIAASGEAYNITLTYGPEAMIPDEATLSVSEVTGEAAEEYLEKTEEALDTAKQVTSARFFDIKIMAGDEEIQPAAPVKVQVVMEGEQAEDAIPCAVHFENNDGTESEVPVVVEATENEDAVEFDADSFSVWGVVYTVDFHYTVNGQTFDYGIPGGDCASLRALLPALGIAADDPDTEADEVDDFMAAVQDVTFSTPELLAVYKVEETATVGALRAALGVESEYSAALTEEDRAAIDGKELTAGDWALFSLKPFTSDETLTVAMDNGDSFAVAVTDAQISTRVITADGAAYIITLTFGPEAEIPLDAQLRAREISKGSDEWLDYAVKTMDALNGDDMSIDFNNRFFDIEIWSGEEKIEPKATVTVNIELEKLSDETLTEKEIKVVHFDEENGPVVMSPEIQAVEDTNTNNIRFDTDSFSVYGVVVDQPSSLGVATNLDGKTAKISHEGRYMTNERLWNQGIGNGVTVNMVGKGTPNQAAEWLFEAVPGQPGQYYISTTDDQGAKAYLHIYDVKNDGHSSINLFADGNGDYQKPKQALTVNNLDDDDTTYTISAAENGNWRFLNEHNGSYGPGFIGWRDGSDGGSQLTLDFQGEDSERTGQYVMVTKFEGEYYVILNDGTLVKTNAPVNGNPVVGGEMNIDDPMMWTYDNGNIYHRQKETGFDGNQLAYDRFYRYLEPDEATALIDEDYDNTTGHLTGYASEYRIDTRPLMNTTQITYADHKISSRDNPSNYVGVVRDENGLRIAGKQSSENAAEIYFVAVTSINQLTDDNRLVNERFHTVNHIDISIVGRAVFSVPLAYGTYYYMVDGESTPRKLVVNKENPITVDIAQEVPIERDDVKRATITAYTIETDPTSGEEVHVPKDNVFFVSGYSGNEENGASTNQTRIEGAFKVADMPPLSADQSNTADWEFVTTEPSFQGVPHYRASEAIRTERLNHKIYYTVSTTKKVTFDFAYNGHKLYSSAAAAASQDAEGVSEGSASVTLSATFNYWDGRNECPPLGWDRTYWRNGGIIYSAQEQTGSGMDFALGTIDKDKYGVLAIEITKFILDDAGNAITPLNDVKNVFHVYRSGAAPSNYVQGKDVDTYKGQMDGYDYSSVNGYVNIHDKSAMVSVGGIGTVYDYDIDPGMIYIQEDTSEANLPRSLEDVNGKTWAYKKTYIETEYVWRDDGIEYRRHMSKEYDNLSEAYNSVPEVLGTYKDINGVSQYNGFLEFYVYNVYEAKPIDIEVKKNWKQKNGFDADIPQDAKITVTLGRYHLVEDEEHPISGALTISHTVRGLQSGDTYFASYKVKLGDNKVLRSGTLTFNGDGTKTLDMTGLNPDTYTLELTESASGYTMNGAKKTVPVTIETGATTTATAYTKLEKSSETQKLVHVHVTNRLESYTDVAYQDNTYSFPAGETLVFTIYRPSRAYRGSGFVAKLNGEDFPWPTEGDDNTWTYVDQHYEYTVPNQDVTLNFVHNWGQREFFIYGVERKKETEQTSSLTSSTTLTSGSAVGGTGGGSGTIQPRVSVVNGKYIPETYVPGMKFVDDDGVWLDAENQPIDKTVILANGMWEEVVKDLPAVDEHGYKYLYYIKSVVEEGVPETTRVEIKSSGDYVLTSDGEETLEVTNWVPNKPPKITLKKVDDNGNPLTGATFQVTKNGSETVGLTPGNNNTTFTTETLTSGTYTVVETPPSGYKGMPESFTFEVNDDNEVVVNKGSLPKGVSYQESTFTFTVENTPQGKLKLMKRWLDLNGNDTAAGGPVTVKLVQMVQNRVPKRVVRVKFEYLNNQNGYTQVRSVVGNGRGSATITWNWNRYCGLSGKDGITIIGAPEGTTLSLDGTIYESWNDNGTPRSKDKSKFKLTIRDTGNGNDTITVRVNNNTYDPFEYGDSHGISDISWSADENTAGEGYTTTGGTRVVELNADNNWTRWFNYSGTGLLDPGSTSDTLPAQYDNRNCRYIVVEDPVPEGYSVTYSDTNTEGIGTGDEGTITVYNRKNTTDVELIKVDKTNRAIPLAGATFHLYQLDSNQRGAVRLDGGVHQQVTTALVGIGTDDEKALATFANLPIGCYEIVETEAPTNYKVGDEPSFYIKVTTKGVFAIVKDDSKYPARWSVRSNDSRVMVNKSRQFVVGDEPDYGALKLTKVVQVNGKEPASSNAGVTDGTYEFSIAGNDDADNFARGECHTLKITFSGGVATSYQIDNRPAELVSSTTMGSWTVLVPDLKPGTYTVTETDSGNLNFLSAQVGSNAAGETNGVKLTVVAGDKTGENASAQVVYTNNKDVVDIDATKTWKCHDGRTCDDIQNVSVTFTLQSRAKTDIVTQSDETTDTEITVDTWTEWATVTGLNTTLNGYTETVTLPQTGVTNPWTVAWTNLPKYNDNGQLLQYSVREYDAKLADIAIPLPKDPTGVESEQTLTNDARTNPYKTISLINTLPKTSIEVTKEWKDSHGEDRVFTNKSIGFTLYQQVGNGTPSVYTTGAGVDSNGHGTITYHPAEAAHDDVEAVPAHWDTVTINNLEKYVYVSGTNGTTGQWELAKYYVVEDSISGVSIAYTVENDPSETGYTVSGSGNSTSFTPEIPTSQSEDNTETGTDTGTGDTTGSTPANDEDASETVRTITITNTDEQVDLVIVKAETSSLPRDGSIPVSSTALTKLSGAEFKLMRVRDDNPSVAHDYEEDPDTQTQVPVVSTGTTENGELSFKKLAAGYYKVTETKAPDGYILTEGREFYIRVDSGSVSMVQYSEDTSTNPTTYTWAARDPNTTDSKLRFTYTVATSETPLTGTATVGNEKGAALPSTGGPGTTLFYVVGSIITLLAAVLLITKRRSYDGD